MSAATHSLHWLRRSPAIVAKHRLLIESIEESEILDRIFVGWVDDLKSLEQDAKYEIMQQELRVTDMTEELTQLQLEHDESYAHFLKTHHSSSHEESGSPSVQDGITTEQIGLSHEFIALRARMRHLKNDRASALMKLQKMRSDYEKIQTEAQYVSRVADQHARLYAKLTSKFKAWTKSARGSAKAKRLDLKIDKITAGIIKLMTPFVIHYLEMDGVHDYIIEMASLE